MVHAALEQTSTDYAIVTVDYETADHDSVAFQRLSPLGQVPVLVLPDGSSMTESAAIVIYLTNRFPDANLCPPQGSPSHPHFLRWLVFCAANIYMADLRYYYANRHTNDPAGIDGIRAVALKDMDAQFAILDDAIRSGPFLLGDNWSILDVYAAMLACWHPDPPALFADCPNLHRLCEHIKAIDCVRRANEYHCNLSFNEAGAEPF